ncbi:trace amine-associated receptor 13c-like [Esox lucius]|uniref:trace amine-associated receptor 13c-like n=1 Tax=Esox lucius TaxID=8010 RepID=UPI0014769D81|nr:trace amine-associated receptor 13c-like [Esox lucius]
MEEHGDDQLCFQDRNSSCRNNSLSTSIYIIIYIFFSLISVLTVFFNLVVIISIANFKQLHTTTNLLILSLAVSDLLVGLIVIPAITVAIIEPCWVVGEYVCALLMYTAYLCTSLSLGNLILISIDRYVAICNPLLYHSKITTTRIYFCIAMIWYCSIIYNGVLIKLSANKSEKKAAKTLAIVVFNYLICWIPTYFIQYIYLASGDSSAAFILFLPFINSFINPIIYAFFYPWFKGLADGLQKAPHRQLRQGLVLQVDEAGWMRHGLALQVDEAGTGPAGGSGRAWHCRWMRQGLALQVDEAGPGTAGG